MRTKTVSVSNFGGIVDLAPRIAERRLRKSPLFSRLGLLPSLASRLDSSSQAVQTAVQLLESEQKNFFRLVNIKSDSLNTALSDLLKFYVESFGFSNTYALYRTPDLTLQKSIFENQRTPERMIACLILLRNTAIRLSANNFECYPSLEYLETEKIEAAFLALYLEAVASQVTPIPLSGRINPSSVAEIFGSETNYSELRSTLLKSAMIDPQTHIPLADTYWRIKHNELKPLDFQDQYLQLIGGCYSELSSEELALQRLFKLSVIRNIVGFSSEVMLERYRWVMKSGQEELGRQYSTLCPERTCSFLTKTIEQIRLHPFIPEYLRSVS